MKKTEKLNVVEGFLSSRGIEIESFYVIRMDNYDFVLQGEFSELSSKVCVICKLELNDLGHAVGNMNVPIENSKEVINVRIVLT